jgi:hypothetical protein
MITSQKRIVRKNKQKGFRKSIVLSKNNNNDYCEKKIMIISTIVVIDWILL